MSAPWNRLAAVEDGSPPPQQHQQPPPPPLPQNPTINDPPNQVPGGAHPRVAAQRGRIAGSGNYSLNENMHLLGILEEIVHVDADEWQRVLEIYTALKLLNLPLDFLEIPWISVKSRGFPPSTNGGYVV